MQQVTLETLLRQYTTNSINSLYTAIPCSVVGVPSIEEQRIDVQPTINKVLTDGGQSVQAPILNVPVVFPASRTSQFSFPINVGDTVLCVFSQRSLDAYKQGSGNTPHRPTDLRKYSKNDAVAIPGLFSFPDSRNNPSKRTWEHSTQDAVVVHNIGSASECELRFKPNGDVIINTPNKAEVNCNEFVVNADSQATFNVGGNRILTMTPDLADFDVLTTAPNFVTDSDINLNTHTHSQDNDSDGDSEVDTDAPNPS